MISPSEIKITERFRSAFIKSFIASLKAKSTEVFFASGFFKDSRLKFFTPSGEPTYSRTGMHGHGGEGGNRLKIYFIEGKQTSDTITIKAKVLYGEHYGDTWGPSTYFYSKATQKKDELLYHVEDESHYNDYDFVYNEVKDQLPITTFIFKKQSDGRFALSEIK